MDMFSDGHVLCFSSIGIRFIYSNLFFLSLYQRNGIGKKSEIKKISDYPKVRDEKKINEENVYSFVHVKINGVIYSRSGLALHLISVNV